MATNLKKVYLSSLIIINCLYIPRVGWHLLNIITLYHRILVGSILFKNVLSFSVCSETYNHLYSVQEERSNWNPEVPVDTFVP